MSALQGAPSNTNYLSPIGFRFVLSNFKEVSYFCQTANLPGISIGGIDVPTPMRNIQIEGDEVQFEELSLSFVVDENLKNWLSIYDWIIGLGVPTRNSIEKYKKLKESDEKTMDGVLTILTSNMNAQMEIKFRDMFPLSLSSIEFNTTATDVDYVTSTVSFRYDYYEITNLLQNEDSYEGAPVYNE